MTLAVRLAPTAVRVASALALAAFASGCAGDRGDPAVERLPRVWLDLDTPRTIDLGRHVSGGTLSVRAVESVAASVDGERVTLTPAPGFLGEATLVVTVARGGSRASGLLPVRVKEGIRSCETVFRYRGDASSVHLAGTFNDFDPTALPLDPVGDGRFVRSLALPAGEAAYKFVVDGEWILDPDNPLTAFVDGIENSRVVVPDCASPRLDLVEPEVDGAIGSFRADVVFVAGRVGGTDGGPARADQAPAGPPVVTLDGQPWSAGWDESARVLSIDERDLAPGRHELLVEATDRSGRAAPPVRLSFWAEAKPFDWRDAVVYSVLVDRFRNGDPSNDAPVDGVSDPANYRGGDWAGLRAAIEEGYFDELGVDVLWLSPHVDNAEGSFLGSDGRAYAGYHGYWPASPKAVESRFGSAAELRAAIDAAHARGMRVLLDLVVNHVHEQHPWFDQHPDWFHVPYVCGWEQPIECWFTPFLPDLDLRRSPALDAQVEEALWWQAATGADGFRVDAVKHMERVLGRTLRAAVEPRFAPAGGRFLLLGETFVGRFVDGGADLLADRISPRDYDGQFDFPLYWEILRTIGRREGTLADLDLAIGGSRAAYGPTAAMGTFVGNHDVPRFVSHASGEIDDLYGVGSREQGWTDPPAQPSQPAPYARLRQAFTLLFALPGIPTIYYGDEVGLAGAGDPDNRRPMPWTGLTAEQLATRAHVAQLSAARRAYPELTRGSVDRMWLEDDLLVLRRRYGRRSAFVAVNRGTTPRTVTVDGTLASGLTFDELFTDATTAAQGGTLAVTVAAEGAAVYLQRD